MREIKFRAWNNGKMLYHNPMMSTHDFSIMPNGSVFYKDAPGFVNGKNHDSLIMQFTGLKDKNDKEIYEGDILKFYDRTVAEIVFEPFGGWCFKWTDAAYKRVRSQNPEPIFRNINLFEVVGNIYEHPHLLNESL